MDKIDVVVVPDFAGPAAKLFEARSLLFLGSWLEHRGASEGWPLHLVCIGEPPASVRSLADRCGARITINEPLGLPDSFLTNKLRGLDVVAESGRILLVDVDTVILGDLSPFLELGDHIALAPANQNQVTEEMWREIFDELKVPFPDERILCLRARYQSQLPERYHGRNEGDEMVPYFNSGVLLTPAQAGLKEPWWSYSEQLLRTARQREGRWKTVRTNDQVGLAVAIANLKSRGVPFCELPPACHANYLLFWAGAVQCDSCCIFHGMKLYRLGARDKPFDVESEIRLYESYLRKGVQPDSLIDRGKEIIGLALNDRKGPARQAVQELVERLRDWHRKYVKPAFG